MDELLELFQSLYPDLAGEPGFSIHTDLTTELGLSSIQMIRFLSAIETHFDIDLFSLDADDAAYRSLGAIGDLIGVGD